MRCATDGPYCGCAQWSQAFLAAGPNLLPLHHIAASTASQALRPPRKANSLSAHLAAKLVTSPTALNTPDLDRARSSRSRLNPGEKDCPRHSPNPTFISPSPRKLLRASSSPSKRQP